MKTVMVFKMFIKRRVWPTLKRAGGDQTKREREREEKKKEWVYGSAKIASRDGDAQKIRLSAWGG